MSAAAPPPARPRVAREINKRARVSRETSPPPPPAPLKRDRRISARPETIPALWIPIGCRISGFQPRWNKVIAAREKRVTRGAS
jgi:hypothetical protein